MMNAAARQRLARSIVKMMSADLIAACARRTLPVNRPLISEAFERTLLDAWSKKVEDRIELAEELAE